MKKLIPALLLLIVLHACRQKEQLFTNIDAADSGIQFANTIQESQSLSVLNYEYIFNGGGVGIGDFNNDSLPDIYFTGNMVDNALYLNRGDFRFEDVTKQSGAAGNAKWSKGVAIVDINNDGWQDIYVCAAVASDSMQRRNLLYINNGVAKGQIHPTFTESAAIYGLDDDGNGHMAAFFDYDRDGDLDVYLLQNDLDGTYPNEFRPIRKDGSWPNTDKLLQNNFDTTRGHAFFTDVSKQAGILTEGHGLGLAINDINRDGWPDIYVSNDYIGNNILYINNGDGTFTDRCTEYLKHSSRNAMGNDIADINNDGLPDIVETDMAAADNYRKKMMMNDISYQTGQNADRFGYMEQYPRNMLHLNQGMITDPEKNDTAHPAFSEIAYLSGVAHTDWSWAPLLVDADNDGYRDLFISNGLPRDMTDLDFMAYRRNAVATTPLNQVLEQLPEVKVSNYAFSNRGNLQFENQTTAWGWEQPTFSAGMAYADFDRDGDLDMVINNTNMPASLLRNNSRQQLPQNNFLQIRLTAANQALSFGASVNLYYGNTTQSYAFTPYRGYMSAMEPVAHFGLDTVAKIDSLVVVWTDGKMKTIYGVAANSMLTIAHSDSDMQHSMPMQRDSTQWFTAIGKQAGIKFASREADFIDFNIQKLLPHKLTQYGPSVAVGDLNGDGLDDVIFGGGSPLFASIYLQKTDGGFSSAKPLAESKEIKYQDDAGLSLFDADGDGDLDLFVASGGGENPPQTKAYMDHFYENDGRGNFTELDLPICQNRATKGAARAADFDKDGDLDLLVAGRYLPGSYPIAVSSFLYRNDSKDGQIIFTDITSRAAKAMQLVGMVADAIWSDVDMDGFPEIILATEWGPVITLKNDKGNFLRIENGVENEKGLWNSLSAGDIDNDGDVDFIAGNLGINSFLKASSKKPLSIYAADFDGNGSHDAIITHWLQDTIGGQWKEVPLASRDDLLKEMTVMKERFTNYSSYARADIGSLLSKEQLAMAKVLHVTNLQSGWFENVGDMRLVFHPFPLAAQAAPVYGSLVADVDADGVNDILLVGNEHNMSPLLGRIDALNGLVLKGMPGGIFTPILASQSGFYVPGNAKSLASLSVAGKRHLLAGVNMGYARMFAFTKNALAMPWQKNDAYAIVTLPDGSKQLHQWYSSGFLSQSGNALWIPKGVSSIEMINVAGQKRTMMP